MFIGQLRGHTPARRAVQETNLNQERFVNLFDSIGFFRQCRSQGANPDRAALILLDNGQQQLAIHLVESVAIDFQHLQRRLGSGQVDVASTSDLSIITYPPKQAVGNTRCPARTTGDFEGTRLIDFDPQNLSRALDDELKIFGLVELQAENDSETRAEWGGQ